ncbi:MAG: cytidylate kinase family protein [Thermoplasmata archaeon]
MLDVVVCIGGPPGSGKSTAGRKVAERFGLEYRSAGQVFRAEAAGRGLDLEAFGRYAETHPEIDRALDRAMQALAQPGRVLDGRIQGPLCRRHGIPAVSIVITARPEVRAARVAERDSEPLEHAITEIADREASEHRRYRTLYAIDLDTEPTDLTVDSSERSPNEVVEEIARFLERRRKGS